LTWCASPACAPARERLSVIHGLPEFFIIVVILVAERRIQFVTRYAISLLGPRAQVDQLAAIRAKWPVRVMIPGSLGAASGTFYRTRHIYESSVLAANNSAIASFLSKSPWSRE
jgi:hypothetical protein